MGTLFYSKQNIELFDQAKNKKSTLYLNGPNFLLAKSGIIEF
jgi:hypothetical protein